MAASELTHSLIVPESQALTTELSGLWSRAFQFMWPRYLQEGFHSKCFCLIEICLLPAKKLHRHVSMCCAPVFEPQALLCSQLLYVSPHLTSEHNTDAQHVLEHPCSHLGPGS
jgi:hypothetical protein